MCLLYNLFMRDQLKQYTRLIILSILLLVKIQSLVAQNITSPYSILGIGDVDTKDYGRYSASGNASVARRDAASYNFSNPASLTSLPYKTLHFDIAVRGRSSNFLSPGETVPTAKSKDFIIRRASLAFRVTEKTGIAFGLRPYSTMNYKYQQDKVILDGNRTYNKDIDGSGGINQVYFSTGKTLSKRISAGITASWLFGSLQKTTEYAISTASLDIVKQETDFYYGGLFQGGLQYYSLKGKKWRHQFGLVGSISTNLTGELTREYSDGGVIIKEELQTGRKFKLPVTLGIGYSAVNKDKLTLSVEANYYKWKYQKVDYSNSYTYPSLRLSAGLDYSFKKTQGKNEYERSFIGLGINVENSYVRIKNQKLWDYSLTLGGGINISRHISIYTGIEFGTKGDKKANQIRENYTQYILGITLKDVWIGTKRFGRFQ
jgi:hypothetical protein